MKRYKGRRLTRAQRDAFLASPKGQEWLEKKIEEKRRSRPNPGPAPWRLRRTRYPFRATINGQPVTVDRTHIGRFIFSDDEA
jgi:hypothetical protein